MKAVAGPSRRGDGGGTVDRDLSGRGAQPRGDGGGTVGRALGPGDRPRVVAHVDLDAFYAQVEHRRLGVPRTKPLGVQQWSGLIAVNYPARAAGVRRGARVEEAKRLCPDLVCVHVETVGGSAAGDRKTSKASLDRYRTASMEVMDVLCRFEAVVVERASIDEAYLDLTTAVEGRLAERKDRAGGGGTPESEGELRPDVRASTRIIGEEEAGAGFFRGSQAAFLLEGARLVAEIRAEVLAATEYTMSAGISTNKLLSKVASAQNKPNLQTVIYPAAAAAMIGAVELKKIPKLGGKLGDEVLAWMRGFGDPVGGAAGGAPPTAALLQKISAARAKEMRAKFGPETAAWLANICQGADNSAVKPNMEPKSLLAFKSFEAISTVEAGRDWLEVLAEDLANRMRTDKERWNRVATSITLHCRGRLNKDHLDQWQRGNAANLTTTVSRTMRMPGGGGAYPPSAAALVEAGLTLWGRCGAGGGRERVLLPCTRLALGASKFAKLPEGKGIGDYLVAVQRRPAQEEEEAGKAPVEKPVGEKAEEEGGAEAASATFFVCARCRATLPSVQEAVHRDMHFAEDLARREVAGQHSLANGIGQGPPQPQPEGGAKRRKTGAASAKGGGGGIAKFFRRPPSGG